MYYRTPILSAEAVPDESSLLFVPEWSKTSDFRILLSDKNTYIFLGMKTLTSMANRTWCGLEFYEVLCRLLIDKYLSSFPDKPLCKIGVFS